MKEKLSCPKFWILITLALVIIYLLWSRFKKTKQAGNGGTTILSLPAGQSGCGCNGNCNGSNNNDPVNLQTGENIIPTDLPNYLVNENQFGFNSFDSTGSRMLAVPLQKRKETIYIEPFNQWGGQIKDF